MPWGCLRFVIVVFPDHTHLLFLSALSLSESTVESMIPIDSSLQKSSRLGFFFGNDLSGISRLVSSTVFVEYLIISMLYTGVSSVVSVVRPVNIHHSLVASMYNPGCTSTLRGKIKSK